MNPNAVADRIAAKNAIKIRAALRASIDPKAVIEHYLHTMPDPKMPQTQARARARAWAVHNVKIDQAPLIAAMKRHYAEMYSFGQARAEDNVYKSLKAREKSLEPISWEGWTPGNRTAAALISPSGGLKALLDGIQIKSLAQSSTYDLLGTALADGIAQGLGGTALASLIQDHISTPDRALLVARTEGSRAANAAQIDTYQAMGVSQVEWSAVDPTGCACVDLDGEQVDIGEVFPSSEEGVTQPPEHPNCVCTLLAVIPDTMTFDTISDYTNGMDLTSFGAMIGAANTTAQNASAPDDGEDDDYATFAPDLSSKPRK
jgi:SPP1 gp7 family putative phage head morphogenesis protein